MTLYWFIKITHPHTNIIIWTKLCSNLSVQSRNAGFISLLRIIIPADYLACNIGSDQPNCAESAFVDRLFHHLVAELVGGSRFIRRSNVLRWSVVSAIEDRTESAIEDRTPHWRGAQQNVRLIPHIDYSIPHIEW